MINVVFWTVAAAAFVAAGFKAYNLRSPDAPPGLGSTCLLLVTIGLALVLISDGAQQAENALYPNLGRLLSNLCTTVAAFAALAHQLSVTCPQVEARVRIRRWLVALLAAVTAMTGLFVASPLPPVIGDFGPLYRGRPALVGYILIFVVFLGWSFTRLAVITAKYAGPAARPALRTGLRIVTLGCVLLVVYLVEKTVVVVSQWLQLGPLVPGQDQPCTSPLHPPGCVFAVGLPLLAALAITIGMTLPAWGPAAAAPVRWLRYWRIYRRLDPLWRALAAAMPQIVLPRNGPDRFSYRYGVHRRVIEIRDGLLILGPYRHSKGTCRVETSAGGAELDARQAAALHEATSVRMALAAYLSGHPAETPIYNTTLAEAAPPTGRERRDTTTSGTGSDLGSEVDWLMRVSLAFSASADLVEALVEAPRTRP
ncbi:MAB_1171c family putative transporter [Actinomadura macra]|uniref:MAB_1171c family putative transporter n=1 Tax=Actinomadura macra TaxID=46164 RepID=UPI0008302162|nr:MAB_1171c family putative transporter [Actinomadura macra]